MNRQIGRCVPCWSSLALLLGLFVSVAGCGQSPAEPPDEAAAPNRLPEGETWEVLTMEGQKVGYASTSIEYAEQDGRPVMQFQTRMRMKFSREGQVVEPAHESSGVETAAGELLEYTSKFEFSANVTSTTGRAQGSQFRISTVTPGGNQSRQIPWASPASMFAVPRSLASQPMKPGESRNVVGFDGTLHALVEYKLRAEDYENTPLMDETRRLLRIRQKQFGAVKGPPIETVLWVDEHGEVLKQFDTNSRFEVHRATKSEALAAGPDAPLDLFHLSLVRLAEPIHDPYSQRQLRYQIELENLEPAEAFATGPGQKIDNVEGHSAQLTVRTVRTDTPLAGWPAETGPNAADREPNTLIQSDDARVKKIAAEVAPDERDTWRLGVALERHVHRLMKKKKPEYTRAFASAAEVAEDPTGDCTEFAVLLAALARARGIPARVAMGLVYVEPRPDAPQQAKTDRGFLYHMWTEVWIEDRWVGLDATIGQGGLDAVHLKVADSNLAGVSPYSSFLPVARVMGNLKIKRIEKGQ